MQQIIECVPNFSDGRRPEVYNRIADAIRRVAEVQVLDVSPDADHNRTVITFVGSPAGVEEAAFQAIAQAKELINLDEHHGEHPRIGATDVCPFIPVRNVSLGDCKAVAYRLGERVGRELEVAVYYYGYAARRPERELLADIRKGEYEGWKAEVGRDPAREPDAGPARPAPWGATVIGVRHFLIAYNVYLNTSQVAIAEAIAAGLRYQTGGFRYLQARGFLVEGQAQVSMNFTNFNNTPLHRVQEAIRREAARYGVAITRAELVGLIPQKALVDAAQWYLQLDNLHDNQILENRLQAGSPTGAGLNDFIAATAASTPTPGGGSAAALGGALGAALVQMVAGLTVGRKKYREVHEEAEAIRQQAEALRQRLTDAIAADAEAFESLMQVTRDKLLTGEARAAALEAATRHAAEVPRQVAQISLEVARLALAIVKIGNLNAVTDAASAAYLAQAAASAATLNVRVNSVGLADQALAAQWRDELATLNAEVRQLAAAVAAEGGRRAGF